MAPLAKRIGTRATSRRKCKYSGSQLDLLPAFTAFSSDWLLWGFVSGYRCATAPDSHRIPCHFRGQSPEKSRFGKQDASRNWKTPQADYIRESSCKTEMKRFLNRQAVKFAKESQTVASANQSDLPPSRFTIYLT